MAARVVRVFLHGHVFKDCDIITIPFLFINLLARDISELVLNQIISLLEAAEGMSAPGSCASVWTLWYITQTCISG